MTIKPDEYGDEIFYRPQSDGIEYLPDTPGVYCILNRANGRWYVGRTLKSIRQRCRLHRNALRKGEGGNWAMQRDCKVHGVDAFFFMAPDFDLSAEVRRDEWEMDKIEVWLVRQLRAYDEQYGYNSEAGHRRTKAAQYRDRERKLLKGKRQRYELLPGVDLREPINPTLLASWVPGD